MIEAKVFCFTSSPKEWHAIVTYRTWLPTFPGGSCRDAGRGQPLSLNDPDHIAKLHAA
jgi:hypothetical protein